MVFFLNSTISHPFTPHIRQLLRDSNTQTIAFESKSNNTFTNVHYRVKREKRGEEKQKILFSSVLIQTLK